MCLINLINAFSKSTNILISRVRTATHMNVVSGIVLGILLVADLCVFLFCSEALWKESCTRPVGMRCLFALSFFWVAVGLLHSSILSVWDLSVVRPVGKFSWGVLLTLFPLFKKFCHNGVFCSDTDVLLFLSLFIISVSFYLSGGVKSASLTSGSWKNILFTILHN